MNFAALSWQYEVAEYRDSDFIELRQARTTCRFSRHFGPRDRSQLRFTGTLLWIYFFSAMHVRIYITHDLEVLFFSLLSARYHDLYITIAIFNTFLVPRVRPERKREAWRFCSFFYDCRYPRNTRHHFTLFQHDPEQCTPGGEDGNFIMFARATSGDKRNNNRFSPCSLSAINPVLNSKARSPKGCFTGQSLARYFYVSFPPIEYRIFEFRNRKLFNMVIFPPNTSDF